MKESPSPKLKQNQYWTLTCEFANAVEFGVGVDVDVGAAVALGEGEYGDESVARVAADPHATFWQIGRVHVRLSGLQVEEHHVAAAGVDHGVLSHEIHLVQVPEFHPPGRSPLQPEVECWNWKYFVSFFVNFIFVGEHSVSSANSFWRKHVRFIDKTVCVATKQIGSKTCVLLFNHLFLLHVRKLFLKMSDFREYQKSRLILLLEPE